MNLPASLPAKKENDQPVVVTVTRDDTRFAATIDYAVTETGPHRLVPETGTLSFAAGVPAASFDVQLVDDTQWRSAATVAAVTLQKPSQGHGSLRWNRTFQITDDDPATLHDFAATAYSINEAAGPLVVEIVRTGRIDVPSTAKVTVDGWYGAWPEPEKQTTFAPGETRKTLAFPLPADSNYNGRRQATLELSSQTNGDDWLKGPTVPVELIDDEPYPTITISVPSITETDANFQAFATVTAMPPFAAEVWFWLNSTPLTAEAGVDYSLANSFGRFQPGLATIQYPLTIYGDNLIEKDETFRLTGRFLQGSEIESDIITIHDDDGIPYGYALISSSFTFEEQVGTASFAVRRTGDLSGSSEATLRVIAPPDTPTRWPQTSIPLKFAAGASQVDVLLPLPVDAWYTGPREVELQVVLNDQPLTSTTLTVVDDEPRPSLIVDDVTTTEGTKLYVPVRITGLAGFPIHFTTQFSAGTAEAGKDYGNFGATWPDYIVPGNLGTSFIVDIAKDAEVEPDETFFFTVSNCCGPHAILAKPTATITINGDQPAAASYKFSGSTAATVNENAGSASIAVQRSGDVSKAASLQIRDDDFNPSSAIPQTPALAPVSIDFAAGETSRSVLLPINDAFWSGTRTRYLRLVHNGTVVDSFGLTILEDEPIPAFKISSARATESPNGSVVSFPFTMTPAYASDVRIVAAAVPGTAHANIDFDARGQELILPRFATQSVVHFTVFDDQSAEPDEHFDAVVTVHRPGGVTDTFLATGTIVDDDGWMLDPGAATVPLGPFQLRVSSPSLLSQTVTLPIVSSNPAVIAVPSAVTIPAGRGEATFTAEALRRGTALITATLPASLSARTVTSSITARELLSPIATPTSLRITAGATATLTLSLQPTSLDSVLASLITGDASIASASSSVTIVPGATATISVRGIKAGKTTIEVVLPVEVGAQSMTIPVEVLPASTKRRGVRH